MSLPRRQRSGTPRPLRRLACALCLCAASAAHADFFLVVQAASPNRISTRQEVVDLFMGRSRAFADGEFALVFDLPRDNPARAAFYKALTGMNPAQVNSYWARLMFAGQSMPPQPLPDEQAMVDIVKRNPSAIGWLSKEPSDKALRVVLVIKDPG